MGKVNLSLNPSLITLRHKVTGKHRWMRCQIYQTVGEKVSVTSIKGGRQVSEWFNLNEWEIVKTDAPETAPPNPVEAPALRLVPSEPAAPLAFTPRGTENPNAPKTPEEAAARLNDTRKVGNLKVELPGEYNAYAHLDKTNPMGIDSDPEKAALQAAQLKASIAANITLQEAMTKINQAKARRQMLAQSERGGFGVLPS